MLKNKDKILEAYKEWVFHKPENSETKLIQMYRKGELDELYNLTQELLRTTCEDKFISAYYSPTTENSILFYRTNNRRDFSSYDLINYGMIPVKFVLFSSFLLYDYFGVELDEVFEYIPRLEYICINNMIRKE